MKLQPYQLSQLVQGAEILKMQIDCALPDEPTSVISDWVSQLCGLQLRILRHLLEIELEKNP